MCKIWRCELVGVESALGSLLLSLGICVAAVSVFTAHPLLLLPVLITIIGKTSIAAPCNGLGTRSAQAHLGFVGVCQG